MLSVISISLWKQKVHLFWRGELVQNPPTSCYEAHHIVKTGRWDSLLKGMECTDFSHSTDNHGPGGETHEPDKCSCHRNPQNTSVGGENSRNKWHNPLNTAYAWRGMFDRPMIDYAVMTSGLAGRVEQSMSSRKWVITDISLIRALYSPSSSSASTFLSHKHSALPFSAKVHQLTG